MACIDLQLALDNVISQYQGSPKFLKLLTGLFGVRQKLQADILCEMDKSLLIDHAHDWLLTRIGDNWGYPRPSMPSGNFTYWGFDNDGVSFDQAGFYGGQPDPWIPVGDDLYKKLLKAWVLGRFYDGSLAMANFIVEKAFDADDAIKHSYIVDWENMKASVILVDIPYIEASVIARSGIIPKPAGVQYTEYIRHTTKEKYFALEGYDGTGFNQGIFQEKIIITEEF